MRACTMDGSPQASPRASCILCCKDIIAAWTCASISFTRQGPVLGQLDSSGLCGPMYHQTIPSFSWCLLLNTLCRTQALNTLQRCMCSLQPDVSSAYMACCLQACKAGATLEHSAICLSLLSSSPIDNPCAAEGFRYIHVLLYTRDLNLFAIDTSFWQ
jgi:hypothetical protein